MLNVILDAIIDSLKVFGVALLIFVVFSLIEEKITNFLAKRRTNQSLIGAACGSYSSMWNLGCSRRSL